MGGDLAVLIVGASGFIGRALVSHLTDRVAKVVAVSRTEIKSGNQVAGVHYCCAENTDIAPILMQHPDIDTVVFAAGRAHRRDNGTDFLPWYQEVNQALALKCAKAAASGGVKHFIYLSSIGVNGSGQSSKRAYNESMVPQPAEAYAVSKLGAEQELLSYFSSCAADLTIVRPPLVYGLDAPGNFGLLTRLVASGLPLPFGCIDNRRSFLYLGNLTDFIYTCIVNPAAANEIFVVSDDDDVSTTALLKKVRAAMGRRQLLLPVPVFLLKLMGRLSGRLAMVEKLTDSLVVDCSKARRLLAWRPPFSLDEGIRRSVRGKV